MIINPADKYKIKYLLGGSCMNDKKISIIYPCLPMMILRKSLKILLK